MVVGATEVEEVGIVTGVGMEGGEDAAEDEGMKIMGQITVLAKFMRIIPMGAVDIELVVLDQSLLDMGVAEIIHPCLVLMDIETGVRTDVLQ